VKQAKLLWIDLEMTGLDPNQDKILEVATIATDWDFNEIAKLEAVQKVSESLIKKRMTGEFWDKYADVRKQLTSQNKKGETVTAVERKLLDFVDEHFEADEKILLAGNSIHQDRKFIDNEWPKFAKKLHYRMLDVSAWKVVFEGKYRRKFAKPETHRALEDIQGSIAELKYYLRKIK